MHTLWTLFLALWSYLCTSYPENDGSPFASYIFSSPTRDVCSPALHVPLQLPPACWGWDWCRMPLRVPQAHQGVSPHVCVPLLRLGTDGLGWPIGFNVAGHLLAVPHQALLHKIFLHPCPQVKKNFKGSFILLLYFFSSWSFLWVKSLQANAWLLVNLAGGHLYPSSTSLFKHLGWLAFGGLGLGVFLSFPSHNWLFRLLGSFKRWNGLVASSNQNFEKGFETRYLIFICLKWDILLKPVIKDVPKGKRDKGISDCCLLQAYRQYRGRFFSEALNKGTRSNSFKFHQGKFQGFI